MGAVFGFAGKDEDLAGLCFVRFTNNEGALHDAPVAGDGAEVGVGAGFFGGAEPEDDLLMGIGHGSGVEHFGEVRDPVAVDALGGREEFVDGLADLVERARRAEDEVVLDGVGVVQAELDGGVGGDLQSGFIKAELVGDRGDLERDECEGVEPLEGFWRVAEGSDGIEQGDAVSEGGGPAVSYGSGFEDGEMRGEKGFGAFGGPRLLWLCEEGFGGGGVELWLRHVFGEEVEDGGVVLRDAPEAEEGGLFEHS